MANSFLKTLKLVNPKKIPKYILHFPRYVKLFFHEMTKDKRAKKVAQEKDAKVNSYFGFFKKSGLDFGIVKGTNETYVFDLKDECIPGEMFFWRETFSEGTIKLFFDLCSKKRKFAGGGYLLDIGANIGTTSVYISKNINPNLKIIAFEPDALNYRLLVANCALNDCKNVRCENVALSDQSGTMQMLVNEQNRGASKILQEGETENVKTETVNVCSVDDYLKAHDIDAKKIEYVWMDVEGHEAHALNGMKNLLLESKPPMWMEFIAKLYSENDFELLYKTLSCVYTKMIANSFDMNPKEYEISYIKELYKNDFWGDLFFY